MRTDMRKAEETARSILSGVVILGISIQIFLGLFWILFHFSAYQEFGESYFLQRVQESLICDEYVGILYPLLMRLATGLASLLPIPWYCFLYALQLMAAAGAAHCLLKTLKAYVSGPFLSRLWAVLAFLTFPGAAQCHLAVLPISLTASLFLISLGIFWGGALGDKAKENRPLLTLAKLGVLWLLMALLMPDYRILGALPLVLRAARELFQGRKRAEEKGEASRIFRLAMLTAVFLGVVPLISGMTIREGAWGRMQKTPEAAAFRRFAWDDLGKLYSYWPQELKDALSQEDIRVINQHPEQKTWILGQNVDGRYGKEKAREIYGAMAKVGYQIRWRHDLKEIGQDFLGYGFSPVAELVLSSGKGQATFAGMNYDVMRRRAPRFTSVFVRYAGWCFLGSIVLCGILRMMELAGEEKREKRASLLRGLTYLIFAIVILLYYVFQGGGVMDAKNVLPVTSLWMLWCCKMALGARGAQKAETEVGSH